MSSAQWVALLVFTVGVYCVPWIAEVLRRAAELAERAPATWIVSDDGSLVWVLYPPSGSDYPPWEHHGG